MKTTEVKYGLRSLKTGNLLSYVIDVTSEKFVAGVFYTLEDHESDQVWLVDSIDEAIIVRHDGKGLGTGQYFSRPLHNFKASEIEIVRYTVTTEIEGL